MEFNIRKITYNDYNLNYMNLINVFTKEPLECSYDIFCKYLDIIRTQNSEIYVIEDDNKIVSTIKCIIEQKLHNNFKCVGHIEDLVTLPEYRNKGLASKLLTYAINECKKHNIYKIILSTNENNLPFYIKNGFIKKGTECCMYI